MEPQFELFSLVPPTFYNSSPQSLQQLGTIKEMAPQTDSLFIIALYLASLSYFLGVLIYMLPLPFRGLKEWAPKLIKDAVYIVAWLSAYTYILSLAQNLLSILGASWQSYFNTMNEEITGIAGIYGFILVLLFLVYLPKFILAAKTLDFTDPVGILVYIVALIVNFLVQVTNIRQVLANLASLALNMLMYLIAIQSVSLLIYETAPLLIVLGILLMSLPFRIGRPAGSTMIATVLVFYIGIPLMPHVLAPFEEAIGVGTAGYLIGTLQSEFANPVVFVTNAFIILNSLKFIDEFLPAAYFAVLVGITFGVAEVIGEGTADPLIPLEGFIVGEIAAAEMEEEEEKIEKETEEQNNNEMADNDLE